ncbi:MAG TPA: DUF302 domain-containing protein [Bryobacteraceae bacterium]|nr:DUF302 domain-containing protein [Bryobacteraceae bacterium]HOQ47048.1 DUF302 domain-containing protein [Bryobacteraceae bacterium]HPQ14066.1 DUF302 domain-containing protein [Bryobacteraceae bacterium]HPU71079.1 DUF302 domain-containing protein [Bryobacteraceae bacterium]
MLQVTSEHAIEVVETAIRRAARRHGATVLAATHLGQHLPDDSGGAVVFGICAGELYDALLAADPRTSAFLPCRIAAYVEAGRVTFASVSPLDFCRLLNRPDLAPLAAPLQELLMHIMQDAAQPQAAAEQSQAGAQRGSFGATEEQVSMRASIPQRIDCRGSKVEDIAGTGGHDSQGG